MSATDAQSSSTVAVWLPLRATVSATELGFGVLHCASVREAVLIMMKSEIILKP